MTKAEEARLADEARRKIEAMGYEFDITHDKAALLMFIDEAAAHIMNICNINSIPKRLEHELTDMACGEFLYRKYSSGELKDGFNFEAAVTQISEGDVSIGFDSDSTTSAERRFTDYLNKLRTPRAECLEHFRKMVW